VSETYVAPARNIFEAFALVKPDITTRKIVVETMIMMTLDVLSLKTLQMITGVNISNIIMDSIINRADVVIKEPENI
jgi:hypothetical protein